MNENGGPVVDVTKMNPEEILPHRGEKLLVSSFRAYQPGCLLATYFVPLSPSWLGLHFPEPIGPYMPGHDIAEALAQVVGVLGKLDLTELDGKMGMLRGEMLEYKAPVRPGDTLYLCAREPEIGHRGRSLKAQVEAYNGDPGTGGKLACEGEITLVIMEMPTPPPKE